MSKEKGIMYDAAWGCVIREQIKKWFAATMDCLGIDETQRDDVA